MVDWGQPNVATQASRQVVVLDVVVAETGKTSSRRTAAVHRTSVATCVSRLSTLGVGALVPPWVVGLVVGALVVAVGLEEGACVSPTAVGLWVGAIVGFAVGVLVGLPVGMFVGAFVSPMFGQTGGLSLDVGVVVMTVCVWSVNRLEKQTYVCPLYSLTRCWPRRSSTLQ